MSHILLLEGTKLQVKLGDNLSEPFQVEQGVGQGKILSTKNYKDYIDPELKLFNASQAGCYIGHLYVATPTCADDVLLLTSCDKDLQKLLSLAFEFSRQECFNIHPGKTKIILYNYKGPKLENLHQWYLGDKIVNLSQSLEHLGITRYASVSSTKELISDRIKSAG